MLTLIVLVLAVGLPVLAITLRFAGVLVGVSVGVFLGPLVFVFALLRERRRAAAEPARAGRAA